MREKEGAAVSAVRKDGEKAGGELQRVLAWDLQILATTNRACSGTIAKYARPAQSIR